MSNEPIEDGGAAFPTIDITRDSAGEEFRTTYFGMSLRDWYAGHAMAGLLSVDHRDVEPCPTWTAETAYNMADTMLEQRKHQPNKE